MAKEEAWASLVSRRFVPNVLVYWSPQPRLRAGRELLIIDIDPGDTVVNKSAFPVHKVRAQGQQPNLQNSEDNHFDETENIDCNIFGAGFTGCHEPLESER
jgi:hypothetical protein